MSLSEWEKDLVQDVSIDRLMETTRAIATWVRLSGSEDEMRAVKYVRALLDGYGLQTEVMMHDAYISLPRKASIVLSNGTSLACITHSFGASTGQEGLEGEVVACADDDLGAARGTIALLNGLAMPGRVKVGEAAGAIAQIYVNGPLTHEMIVSPVWGSPDLEKRAQLPHTPILSVNADGGAAIRAAIERGDDHIRITAEVDTGWRQTPILVASLTVPASDDFLLFSGHLDSWHRGAMDNGSANSAMIEIARLLAGRQETLRRGLRLAFWSGHSHGRYSGSAWYADNYWFELHRHCVAHVNVDSLGGEGASVLSEAIASASTRELGAQVIKELAGSDFHGGRVGRSGDQSFVGLGVPSLWMTLSEQPPSDDPTSTAFGQLVGSGCTGGLGWWWHTTEDTIDRIDSHLLLRDTRIYLVGIARLLCSKLLPLDAGAEAQEVLDILRQLQDECVGRFDLSPAVEQAEQLVRKTSRLHSWAPINEENADDGRCSLFNQMIMGVLRSLLPINYTAAGPFDHDPALTMPRLPLLAAVTDLRALHPDSDNAHFLKIQLMRARNEVVYALDGALRALLDLDELEASDPETTPG